MVKKYINIEIPVCNRDNVFIDYFLKGLKYLTPLKDFLDISILYNGDKATNEVIEQGNNFIKKLGFSLYWEKKDYRFEETGKPDIVGIREDVHRINPNHRPFVLQLDDDMEFTSYDYTYELAGALLFLVRTPSAGWVNIKSSHAEGYEPNTIYSLGEKISSSTWGGILMRSFEEWNGVTLPEMQHLFGSLSDSVVAYARLKSGYMGYGLKSMNYKHFQLRQILHRESGFIAHNWGKTFGQEGNSVKYLREHGLSKDCYFLKSDFENLVEVEPFDFSNMSLDDILNELAKEHLYNTKYDNSILLSIEVPTCNRSNALFKYLLSSLKYLVSLKDICILCMNYNGKMSDSEIQMANQIIEDLGFKYKWVKNSYGFETGKVSTIRLREDAHALYPYAKYSLLLDDDIEFTDENYAKAILQGLYIFERNKKVGGFNITAKGRNGLLIPGQHNDHFWMSGGILLRNINTWSGIYIDEVQQLVGGGEDRLCFTLRAAAGYYIYKLSCNAYLHRQHNSEEFPPGHQIYKWDNIRTENEGTISKYFTEIGIPSGQRYVYPETFYANDLDWKIKIIPVPNFESKQLLEMLKSR